MGDRNPEDFVYIATDGAGIACHQMVNQEDPAKRLRDERAKPRCRGSLVLMSNACKLPLSASLRELRKTVKADHSAVFSNERQFIDHHRSGVAHSWSDDEDEEQD